MIHQVSIDDSAQQLPALIDAALRGEIVLISSGDQQSVQLVPIRQPKRLRYAGSAKGMIQYSEDDQKRQMPPKESHYFDLIEQLIAADAQTVHPSHGDIETLILRDATKNAVALLYVGWSGDVRHHDIIVHARIRDSKICIEHDGTSEGFANTLVAAGVPPDDIVLAFQHPRKRSFTGFSEK